MSGLYEGRGITTAIEDAPGGGSYFSLKDQESAEIRILTPPEDIISVFVHKEKDAAGKWHTLRCLGSDSCPICKAGNKPTYRSYMVLMDGRDNKPKIWDMSKDVVGNLNSYYTEYGDLRDRGYKVTREGLMFDTVYRFIPRDKSPMESVEGIAGMSKDDMPDISKELAPKTPEEMREILGGGSTPPNPPKSGKVFPF